MSDFFRDFSAHDADIDHHAAVWIVMGVEDEGAEECCRAALWERECRSGSARGLRYAHARFGGNA